MNNIIKNKLRTHNFDKIMQEFKKFEKAALIYYLTKMQKFEII
jgi:hypothetical protein